MVVRQGTELQAGSGSGHAELSKTGKARKQELETEKSTGKNAGKLDETKQTGNRQTENTGINTRGIMRKMGDTLRGVETCTKTGEPDQGVTILVLPGLKLVSEIVHQTLR